MEKSKSDSGPQSDDSSGATAAISQARTTAKDANHLGNALESTFNKFREFEQRVFSILQQLVDPSSSGTQLTLYHAIERNIEQNLRSLLEYQDKDGFDVKEYCEKFGLRIKQSLSASRTDTHNDDAQDIKSRTSSNTITTEMIMSDRTEEEEEKQNDLDFVGANKNATTTVLLILSLSKICADLLIKIQNMAHANPEAVEESIDLVREKLSSIPLQLLSTNSDNGVITWSNAKARKDNSNRSSDANDSVIVIEKSFAPLISATERIVEGLILKNNRNSDASPSSSTAAASSTLSKSLEMMMMLALISGSLKYSFSICHQLMNVIESNYANIDINDFLFQSFASFSRFGEIVLNLPPVSALYDEWKEPVLAQEDENSNGIPDSPLVNLGEDNYSNYSLTVIQSNPAGYWRLSPSSVNGSSNAPMQCENVGSLSKNKETHAMMIGDVGFHEKGAFLTKSRKILNESSYFTPNSFLAVHFVQDFNLPIFSIEILVKVADSCQSGVFISSAVPTLTAFLGYQLKVKKIADEISAEIINSAKKRLNKATIPQQLYVWEFQIGDIVCTFDEGIYYRNAKGMVNNSKGSLVNGWRHIAAVFNGAKATLYVNGEVQSSIPVRKYQPNSDAPLYIGAGLRKIEYPNSNDASDPRKINNQQFHGWLQDLSIFSIPLSQSQIIQHWKAASTKYVFPDDLNLNDNLDSLSRLSESDGLIVMCLSDLCTKFRVANPIAGLAEIHILPEDSKYRNEKDYPNIFDIIFWTIGCNFVLNESTEVAGEDVLEFVCPLLEEAVDFVKNEQSSNESFSHQYQKRMMSLTILTILQILFSSMQRMKMEVDPSNKSYQKLNGIKHLILDLCCSDQYSFSDLIVKMKFQGREKEINIGKEIQSQALRIIKNHFDSLYSDRGSQSGVFSVLLQGDYKQNYKLLSKHINRLFQSDFWCEEFMRSNKTREESGSSNDNKLGTWSPKSANVKWNDSLLNDICFALITFEKDLIQKSTRITNDLYEYQSDIMESLSVAHKVAFQLVMLEEIDQSYIIDHVTFILDQATLIISSAFESAKGPKGKDAFEDLLFANKQLESILVNFITIYREGFVDKAHVNRIIPSLEALLLVLDKILQYADAKGPIPISERNIRWLANTEWFVAYILTQDIAFKWTRSALVNKSKNNRSNKINTTFLKSPKIDTELINAQKLHESVKKMRLLEEIIVHGLFKQEFLNSIENDHNHISELMSCSMIKSINRNDLADLQLLNDLGNELLVQIQKQYPIPRIQQIRFNGKTGSDYVWKALYVYFYAILFQCSISSKEMTIGFIVDNSAKTVNITDGYVLSELWKSSWSILNWISERKQVLQAESYENICKDIIKKCLQLMISNDKSKLLHENSIESISDHDIKESNTTFASYQWNFVKSSASNSDSELPSPISGSLLKTFEKVSTLIKDTSVSDHDINDEFLHQNSRAIECIDGMKRFEFLVKSIRSKPIVSFILDLFSHSFRSPSDILSPKTDVPANLIYPKIKHHYLGNINGCSPFYEHEISSLYFKCVEEVLRLCENGDMKNQDIARILDSCLVPFADNQDHIALLDRVFDIASSYIEHSRRRKEITEPSGSEENKSSQAIIKAVYPSMGININGMYNRGTTNLQTYLPKKPGQQWSFIHKSASATLSDDGLRVSSNEKTGEKMDAIVRSSHGIMSGTHYYEIWHDEETRNPKSNSNTTPSGSLSIIAVGLLSNDISFSYNHYNFPCGCRLALRRDGSGLSIYVDIHKRVFSVFSLKKENVQASRERAQRPIQLDQSDLIYSQLIPPILQPPYYHVLGFLAQDVALRSSFFENSDALVSYPSIDFDSNANLAKDYFVIPVSPSHWFRSDIPFDARDGQFYMDQILNDTEILPEQRVNIDTEGTEEEKSNVENTSTRSIGTDSARNRRISMDLNSAAIVSSTRSDGANEDSDGGHDILFPLQQASSIARRDQELTTQTQKTSIPSKRNLIGPLADNLESETQLYVCGQNEYYELGLNDKKPRKELVKASGVDHIYPVQVIAGNEATLVLSSDGKVYSWGYNKFGSCGHGISISDVPRSHVSLPTLIKELNRKVVERICGGNGSEHFFAITSEGELFGWGLNKFGQLGIGNTVETVFQPTQVKGALLKTRIVSVGNGYSHSLALCSDGTVYAFGLNSKGQLGLGTQNDMRTLPQRIDALAKYGRAICVAAGAVHSAVCMEDGSLFTFGKNDFGQLGIVNDETGDPIPMSEFPLRVQNKRTSLSFLKCDAVSCGYYFTVVLAEGSLYSFGRNDFGQCGIGHTDPVYSPTQVSISFSGKQRGFVEHNDDQKQKSKSTVSTNRIKFSDNVRCISIACGTSHALSVTSDGSILGWGRNKYGALGDGTTIDKPYPVYLTFKGGVSPIRGQNNESGFDLGVIQIAAGFHHSAILFGRSNPPSQSSLSHTTQRIVLHGSKDITQRSLYASWLLMPYLFHCISAQSQASAISKDQLIKKFSTWMMNSFQSSVRDAIAIKTNIKSNNMLPRTLRDMFRAPYGPLETESKVNGINDYLDAELYLNQMLSHIGAIISSDLLASSKFITTRSANLLFEDDRDNKSKDGNELLHPSDLIKKEFCKNGNTLKLLLLSLFRMSQIGSLLSIKLLMSLLPDLSPEVINSEFKEVMDELSSTSQSIYSKLFPKGSDIANDSNECSFLLCIIRIIGYAIWAKESKSIALASFDIFQGSGLSRDEDYHNSLLSLCSDLIGLVQFIFQNVSTFKHGDNWKKHCMDSISSILSVLDDKSQFTGKNRFAKDQKYSALILELLQKSYLNVNEGGNSINKSNNDSQKFWDIAGLISILGGNFSIVRTGSRVKVVSNGEIDQGQKGMVGYHYPGSQELVELHLYDPFDDGYFSAFLFPQSDIVVDNDELDEDESLLQCQGNTQSTLLNTYGKYQKMTMYCREQDLVPLDEAQKSLGVSEPLLFNEKQILQLLASILQMSYPSYVDGDLMNAFFRSRCDFFRLQACKSLDYILKRQPYLANLVVSHGYLSTISRMIAASSNQDLNRVLLEKHLLHLEVLRRRKIDDIGNLHASQIGLNDGPSITQSNSHQMKQKLFTWCVSFDAETSTGLKVYSKSDESNPISPNYIQLASESIDINFNIKSEESMEQEKFNIIIKSDAKSPTVADDNLKKILVLDHHFAVIDSQFTSDDISIIADIKMNDLEKSKDDLVSLVSLLGDMNSKIHINYVLNQGCLQIITDVQGKRESENVHYDGIAEQIGSGKWFRLVIVVQSSKPSKTTEGSIKRVSAFVNGNQIMKQKDMHLPLTFIKKCTVEIGDNGKSSNSNNPITDGAKILLSDMQVRVYALSESEIRLLGKSNSQGIALPSRRDLAYRLCEDIGLPMAWCDKVLSLNWKSFQQAKSWLKEHSNILISRACAEAHMLTGLGYDLPVCALAICHSSSISNAISWLVQSGSSGGGSGTSKSNVSDIDARAVSKMIGIIISSSTKEDGKISTVNLQRSHSSSSTNSSEGVGFEKRIDLSVQEARGLTHRRNSRSSASAYSSSSFSADLFDYHEINQAYKLLDVSSIQDLSEETEESNPSTSDESPILHLNVGSPDKIILQQYRKVSRLLLIVYGRSIIVSILGNSLRTEKSNLQGAKTRARNTSEKSLSPSSLSSPSPSHISDLSSRGSLVKQMVTLSNSAQPDESIYNENHFITSYLRAFKASINNSYKYSAEAIDNMDAVLVLRTKLLEALNDEINEISNQIETKRSSDIKASWESSLARYICQELLNELIILSSGSWITFATGLKACPSISYRNIWNDRHTTVSQEYDEEEERFVETRKVDEGSVSVWRPYVPHGFYFLGDVIENPSVTNPLPVVVVSDNHMGSKITLPTTGETLLAPPVSFELVWQSTDESFLECDVQVSIWAPIPPPGYVSLGCIAVRDHSTSLPDLTSDGLENLRCIHESCVHPSILRGERMTLERKKEENNENESTSNQISKVVFRTVENSARTFTIQVNYKSSDAGSENNKSGGGSTSNNGSSSARIERANSEWSTSKRSLVTPPIQTGELNSEANETDDHPLSFSNNLELHGVSLLPSEPKRQKETASKNQGLILPYHMGDINHRPITSGISFWLLNLLTEFDAGAWILPIHATRSLEMRNKMLSFISSWRRKMFSSHLLHVLVRYANNSFGDDCIRALRMLSLSIAKTPFDILMNSMSLRDDLMILKTKMEKLYEKESKRSKEEAQKKDKQKDEIALFSSYLSSLVEVFVSLGLASRRYQEMNIPVFSVTADGENDNDDEYSEDEIDIINQYANNGNTNSDVESSPEKRKMNDRKPQLKDLDRSPAVDNVPSSATSSSSSSSTDNDMLIAAQQQSLREYDPFSLKKTWFDGIVEVACILEALIHGYSAKERRIRSKHQSKKSKSSSYRNLFPNEFLLAEDTFLKVVLADSTVSIESDHPYMQEVFEGDVTIPRAQALLIRFDRRSATNFQDGLRIFAIDSRNMSNVNHRYLLQSLQGNFGSFTILVPSPRLQFQFPYKQSLQWSLDKSSLSKGPDIKVTNEGKTAVHKKDKSWQTVLAGVGFKQGINMWEVRVDQTTLAGNIFFGVAVKGAEVKNYIGCNEFGWGWIGCMACWHGGRKVKYPFGNRLKSGDIIRVTIDIPRRVLLIAQNGYDHGIALDHLTVPGQSESLVYIPAFSFYNKGDQITLLSGSNPDELDESYNPNILSLYNGVEALGEPGSDLQSIVQRYQQTIPTSIPVSSASSLSTVSTSSSDMLSNLSIDRREAVERLSALGYPTEWCILALEACNGDVSDAAEYMISYGHNLEEIVKNSAATRSAQVQSLTVAEEDRWLAAVAQKMGFVSTTSPVSKEEIKDESSERPKITMSKGQQKQQSSASSSSSSQSQKVLASKESSSSSSSSSSEWGFKFTISPIYSREMSIHLANDPLNANRIATLMEKFSDIQLKDDLEIIQMANYVSAISGSDPLMISPEEVNPSRSEFGGKFSYLDRKYPLLTIQLRFLLLRNFNRRLSNSLSLFDLSCADHESKMASNLRKLRGLVFTSVKRTLFERVLIDSHTGDDSTIQKTKNPTVVLDRDKASRHMESGQIDTKGTRTIFGQLFTQLHFQVPASALRNSSRAWYTILAGESADDYGGPFREAFDEACKELMSRALPLFIESPNLLKNEGIERGKWAPNPKATGQLNSSMFEFLGKIIGISIRTKNPMAIDIPSVVWKRLCNEEVVLQDIIDIDHEFGIRLNAIQNDSWLNTNSSLTGSESLSWNEFASQLNITWSAKGLDNQIIDLVPNGRSIPVSYEGKSEYVKLWKQFRIHEIDMQCESIARGVATQVPRNLFSLFTWSELELLVCGPSNIDTELLRRNTVYGEGMSEHHPAVHIFWEALKQFTPDERARYLRFVWGRSRLPVATTDWTRKHKINLLDRDPDDYLPVAHTCFFSIDLPPYKSVESCKEKLLYAITNCVAIDADETTGARLAVERGEEFRRQNENQQSRDENDEETS